MDGEARIRQREPKSFWEGRIDPDLYRIVCTVKVILCYVFSC